MSVFTRRAIVIALASIPLLAKADEVAEARAAASAFRRAVANQRFEEAYDNLLSAFFKEKSKTTKAAFVQNLRNGRALVGEVKKTTDISYTYAESDPVSGYKGKMYMFDYKTVYEKGSFTERLVVIQEADGKYRIGGLWSVPAPL